MHTHVDRFDSVRAFADYAQGMRTPETLRSSVDNARRHDWDLGVGFAGAVSLAQHGWPEGAAKVAELADAIYADLRLRMDDDLQPVADVAGGAVNIGDYLAGAPDCMVAMELQPVPRPEVRIAVSIGFSGSITADLILTRGAAILALAQALIRSGLRVTLVGESRSLSTRGAKVRSDMFIDLIRPGESADVDALAFALVHPAMLRRLGFAVIERGPAEVSAPLTAAGYGIAPSDAPDGFDLHFPWVSAGDSREQSKWASPAAAMATVIDAARRAGILESESASVGR